MTEPKNPQEQVEIEDAIITLLASLWNMWLLR